MQVMKGPRLDERVTELATRLDQEGAGAHCGVADLDIKDLLWFRRTIVIAAQAVDDWLKRRAHNRLGQLAWRVVRARSAPLLTRLKNHRAGGHQIRRSGGVDDRRQGRMQIFKGPCFLYGRPHVGSE